jgi:hypothetical protein
MKTKTCTSRVAIITSADVRVMSTLPPKADMCGGTTDVHYGLKAGIDGLHGPLANVLVFDRNYVTFRACGY